MCLAVWSKDGGELQDPMPTEQGERSEVRKSLYFHSLARMHVIPHAEQILRKKLG